MAAPVSQDVTVTITGTNDAADHWRRRPRRRGGVTEDDDASARKLAASGTITFQDLDLIDTHTATFALKSSTSRRTCRASPSNSTYRRRSR